MTTGAATQHGQVTMNLVLHPTPQSGQAISFVVGGVAVSNNYPGPFVAQNVPAAPVSAVLTTPGWEWARLDHFPVTANGNTNATLEAWRLDPPQAVSDNQFNGSVTLYWTSPVSVQAHANPVLRYNVYRNDTLVSSAQADTVFHDGPWANGAQLGYMVEAVYQYGRATSGAHQVLIDLAATSPESILPTVYQLYPSYPNPFNPDTRIRLDVPTNSTGSLQIYDMEGRLVKTLYSGTLSAGRYQYSWNSRDEQGRSVASGLYFCRFASSSYTATQKMMLIK
jgi:hypothetical protein